MLQELASTDHDTPGPPTASMFGSSQKGALTPPNIARMWKTKEKKISK